MHLDSNKNWMNKIKQFLNRYSEIFQQVMKLFELIVWKQAGNLCLQKCTRICKRNEIIFFAKISTLHCLWSCIILFNRYPDKSWWEFYSVSVVRILNFIFFLYVGLTNSKTNSSKLNRLYFFMQQLNWRSLS